MDTIKHINVCTYVLKSIYLSRGFLKFDFKISPKPYHALDMKEKECWYELIENTFKK